MADIVYFYGEYLMNKLFSGFIEGIVLPEKFKIWINSRIKSFTDVSIKNKVQNILVGSLAVTFLLCTLFFVSLSKLEMRRTYEEKNRDKIKSVSGSFNAIIENVSSIGMHIIANESIQEFLDPERKIFTGSDEEEPDDIKPEEIMEIRSYIYKTVIAYPRCMVFLSRLPDDTLHGPADFNGCVSAAIGRTVPKTEVFFSDGWYGRALREKGGCVIFPDNKNAFKDNEYLDTISVARVINNPGYQTPRGFLVVNVPVDQLEGTYSSFTMSDYSDFAYVKKNGTLIASTLEQDEFDKILKNFPALLENDTYSRAKGNRVVSAQRITDTGIYLVCYSRISFFNGVSFWMVLQIIGIVSIIMLMMYFINMYINIYITTPVTNLSANMQVSDNGIPVQIKNLPDYNDEIGILQKRYNEMTLQINRLLKTVVEEEKQRRNAETRVVQEQMKPHFLYNTLTTISYMALQNSPEEVHDAINTLSAFYRKFLSKGSETVTISEEVSIVQSYIKLLKLRYDDLFEDIYEIEEGLGSVPVIRLILQPLVENSVEHGIIEKGEPGIIRIRVYSENNRIHIKVYDNGIGMTQEQIYALLNGENAKSFGFKGTLTRIRNFYQNDAYVSINSTEGEFCEIDINIPWQR